MKDWKVKQEIFHRLNNKYEDDLNDKDIELNTDIVGNAVKYFTTTELGWVYPAKSYVVGICYAKWISELYSENFYEILNDEDLLYRNDPYFIPYNQNKKDYDAIIKIVGLNFDENIGIIPDIKEYFIKEFNYDYQI
jgi:hypothetical protein